MDRRSGKKGKAITISVIGLGRLGACYAAFAASRGFLVVGVDTDRRKVNAINSALPSVEETNLASYVARNKKRLRATVNTEEATLASSATFIIVPTPSVKNGSFSTDYVVAVCKEIGKALKKKNTYRLVVLVSTLLPSDCRTTVIPAIERASGKQCGKSFGFCYSPSLIAIGDVLNNLEHPDFLFVGAYDKHSEETLAALYKKMYPSIAPECMSIESAELAKIALNSYVTMKITFANTLGVLCEKIPHAHVDHITNALGKDKRIGSHYIKSGLGFGGPCFPRDNAAFAHMAKLRGVKTPLAIATDEFNRSMSHNIAHMLNALGSTHKTRCIGFLGVSYKPRTTLTEESQALFIAKEMLRRGFKVAIFEPLGSLEAESHFGKSVQYPKTIGELTVWSNIIFVSNKDERFHELVSVLSDNQEKKIVVDPWGMFNPADFATPTIYHPIGRKNIL